MKMIIAYIRHEAFEPIRADLLEAGFPSLSITEVKGSGRQKAITEHYRGSELAVHLRPKLKLECVVETKDVELVKDVILRHARTGSVGDGKLFIVPVEEAVRIRTGEDGEDVLQAHGGDEVERQWGPRLRPVRRQPGGDAARRPPGDGGRRAGRGRAGARGGDRRRARRRACGRSRASLGGPPRGVGTLRALCGRPPGRRAPTAPVRRDGARCRSRRAGVSSGRCCCSGRGTRTPASTCTWRRSRL